MILVQELTFSNWKITVWHIFSICLKFLSISAKEHPESDPNELTHSWFRFISTHKKIFLETCCVMRSGLVQLKVIQVTFTWVLASSKDCARTMRSPHKAGQKVAEVDKRVQESRVKSLQAHLPWGHPLHQPKADGKWLSSTSEQSCPCTQTQQPGQSSLPAAWLRFCWGQD